MIYLFYVLAAISLSLTITSCVLRICEAIRDRKASTNTGEKIKIKINLPSTYEYEIEIQEDENNV